MTGCCIVNLCKVVEDSFTLSEIVDTALSNENETHGDILMVNDSNEFVNQNSISLTKLRNIGLVEGVDPPHNSLFAYNNVKTDGNFNEGWVSKAIFDLLQSFQVTVEGLVIIDMNKTKGRQGNIAATDCVAFTDTVENGFTMAISSCGNNNVVLKREPTDADFVFLAVLSKGEIMNLTYASGTIFRSSKGLSGFSGPFPMPLGMSSLSDTYFRFYGFRQNVFVYVTSAGLESVVTLYASDETTVVDGPYTLSPYSSKTLACDKNDEFVVVATSAIYCGSLGTRDATRNANVDMRLLPPMCCELMVWNRYCRITAQETNTKVRWYRQNGETGLCTVNAGTPLAIYTGTINEDVGASNTNAGSTAKYGLEGCLILRSDKPISGFAGADNNGWESTPGWPLDQLSQVFANPSTINGSTSASISSITIGSPYEGTASVYDSSSTLLATFTITRGVSVTTSDDQLYPASGQWKPNDSGLSTYTGGFVETTVPSICVMNFQGSSIWSDEGDELLVPGMSPAEMKATIVKDSNDIARLRKIDGNGVETWVVC